ncbi:MAG TPA: FAD binding domain-containing protein [Solirubrobacteraceae bacterium]|jgi:CO/xanthine dehydrogenase FAD-binding subunit|nr:FAD binding domain-containing protein [Solirubrobacteraceae bacterium]
MKPAPFAYAPAGTTDEALDLLDAEDALPLAGGQSLVPLLNFRLARPALLVDLNPVRELGQCEVGPDGALRIGAMTRQAALLRSVLVAERWPLLTEAMAHVGHAATRSRGTVGGSVAHADPKAELPVALAALGARFQVRSRDRGARVLDAADFFIGPFTTALAGDELLVAIEVPVPPAGARMAFAEHARTHGDFAVAGVAVVVAPGRHAAIALLGAAAVPVHAPSAERALRDGVAALDVARLAATAVDDDYRRALITALTEQAVRRVMA